MSSDIPIFPVAGWQQAALPDKGVFVLEFNFLTHHLQHPSEAQEGRFYALTQPQLRALIADAQKALQTLESSAEKAPPGRRQ